jgi:hypothetical protein
VRIVMARDGVVTTSGNASRGQSPRRRRRGLTPNNCCSASTKVTRVLLRVIDDRLDARVEAAAHDELADVVEQRGRRGDRRKVRRRTLLHQRANGELRCCGMSPEIVFVRS